jgi:hypothetical protein
VVAVSRGGEEPGSPHPIGAAISSGSIAEGSGRPGKGGPWQRTVEANSRRKEDDRPGTKAVNKRATHRQAEKIQRRIRL